ncbi:Protein of unknown function [Gryllus bimaculatus]|nr:Protein of unknown function [Gryllus bimaculatus]
MTECSTVIQQQSDLQTQQNRLIQAEQQWKMMQNQQKQFLQYLHEQRITISQLQQQNSQQVPQLQHSSQLQLSSQPPQQNVSNELNILEKNSAKRQITYDSRDMYSVPVSNRYEIFTEDETN